MPALDTSILVRYLVRDAAAQLAAAKRLISGCAAEGSTLFVPVTVALAMQAGEQPLWTFDKGAAKVSGARLPART
jgi:predicted nucleic acid-binding protein